MRKLLSSIAVLFILASPVSAQVAEGVFYEISDFSDMLSSQVSPFITPKGGAIIANNLRSNDLVGSLAKREKMLLYGNCGAEAIKSLHRYYKSDSTKHLLATSSTILYRGDDDGGTCLTLKSGLSDSKRWQCTTYKDVAICTNGTDRPVKYDGSTDVTGDTDGHRTSGDLAAELGAPFAELNTGSNLDASSWYQYKISYYDGTTYTFSQARTNPILTGATVRNIRLTNIPLGENGTTQRNIFRTSGSASKAVVEADTSYFFVATISDNSTTTFNDTITDATIEGDNAPTRSTVEGGVEVSPPFAKYILIHKERIFLGNDPSGTVSGKSTIYWSEPLKPNYFRTATNFELIQPDDGGEMVGMRNQLGKFVWIKNTSIGKFFTDSSSSDSWELSSPFSYVGTNAPYSIANSPLGILYLGEDGIYSFDGQNTRLISDKVTNTIRDINQTSIADVIGIYYKNEYSMAYTSESTGAGANDRVLILDTVRDSFVIDTKNIDSFTLFNAGTDFGALYGGSSVADGKIFAQEGSPSLWIHRLQSQLEEGTRDSIVYSGTETSPIMELAWGVTIDSINFAGVTIDAVVLSGSTIDREDTSGEWYSKSTQINASDLSKLFWNEILGGSGDVTFAIRSAATENAVTLDSLAFSSEFTNPSGSDISGLTANNWIQLRASLTTTDIEKTPFVITLDNFIIKLSYTTSGTSAETSILTIWRGGYDYLIGQGTAQYKYFPKRITEIVVFYEGTSGTATIDLADEVGDIAHSFTIDFSVEASDSASDDYYGTTTNKVYRYIPPVDEEYPVARAYQITITENGTDKWRISPIMFMYDVDEYYTYPTEE